VVTFDFVGSVTVNGARASGPAIAGVVVAVAGGGIALEHGVVRRVYPEVTAGELAGICG
jgi:hypothetical protein